MFLTRPTSIFIQDKWTMSPTTPKLKDMEEGFVTSYYTHISKFHIKQTLLSQTPKANSY